MGEIDRWMDTEAEREERRYIKQLPLIVKLRIQKVRSREGGYNIPKLSCLQSQVWEQR